MKKLVLSCVLVLAMSGVVLGDLFGTGVNQLTIDFVNMSGATNPASGYGIVNNDYRMGIYEITNDQWDKFESAYGTVTGSPSSAYDESPSWTGTNVFTNEVSWYEGAQFVNWLNTSTGHQEAYKFTGTKGTSDYTFAVWESDDVGYDASNLYRNSNAFYFLPTEDEWVKAAYWNGTSIQTYSNASSGDLVSDEPDPAKWNYSPSTGNEPWAVGIGSEELNGTFDMMGNAWELTESPWLSGDYGTGSGRVLLGGAFNSNAGSLSSSVRNSSGPSDEYYYVGFRIASVPEPCTLILFSLGGIMMRTRRKE